MEVRRGIGRFWATVAWMIVLLGSSIVVSAKEDNELQENREQVRDSLILPYAERFSHYLQRNASEEYMALLDSLYEVAKETHNGILLTYCHLWRNTELRRRGEYDSAYYYLSQSSQLARLLKDTILLREVYFSFGELSQDTEDYMTALAAYRECLRMGSPSLPTPRSIRYTVYNNNALIYENQGDYDDALLYYQKALDLEDSLSYNYRARLYSNMSFIAQTQHDTTMMLDLLYKAYPLAQENRDTSVLISVHLYLANTYLAQGYRAWALEEIEQYEHRFSKFRYVGETDFFATDLLEFYTDLGDYERAAECVKRAYRSMAEFAWPPEYYREFLIQCSKLAAAKGNFKKAVAYMDSVARIGANNNVVLHVLRERDAHFDLLNLHAENEEVIKRLSKENELRKRHNNQRMLLLSLAFLLFAFILMHRYLKMHSNGLRRTQEALIKESDYARQLNQKWGSLENVLNNQRADLEQSTALLQNLLDMLHSHSRKVNHNIEFVRDIQQVMLPDARLIEQAFGESFIIYKPRDIVSGDFYWYANAGPYEMLALVDCAGHGVPGALMSLIGHVLLDKIVKQWRLNTPAQVLMTLHDQIHENLSYQSTTYLGHYSMDLTLIRYEREKRELVFSSASSTLYISTREGVKRYRGSIMSAGSTLANCTYENETVILEPDTWVYLTSDGFTDQLNENFRKYGSNRFQEELARMRESSTSAEDQRFFLLEGLALHQGAADQADDICVIGLHF
ncbi:MAG: SpoIIE family protein phosphatase [Bacteroides sp.]